jgi:hypothetical protein
MPGLLLSSGPSRSFHATVSLSLAASLVRSPLYTTSVISFQQPELRASSFSVLLRSFGVHHEGCELCPRARRVSIRLGGTRWQSTKNYWISCCRTTENPEDLIGENVLLRHRRRPACEGACRIVDRLRNRKTPTERSGMVWHTQGSWKSLTIAFVAWMLRASEDLMDYKS